MNLLHVCLICTGKTPSAYPFCQGTPLKIRQDETKHRYAPTFAVSASTRTATEPAQSPRTILLQLISTASCFSKWRRRYTTRSSRAVMSCTPCKMDGHKQNTTICELTQTQPQFASCMCWWHLCPSHYTYEKGQVHFLTIHSHSPAQNCTASPAAAGAATPPVPCSETCGIEAHIAAPLCTQSLPLQHAAAAGAVKKDRGESDGLGVRFVRISRRRI